MLPKSADQALDVALSVDLIFGGFAMSHADDTTQMWHELAWIEGICDRWDSFFYSLMDQPTRAAALCSLGLLLVSGEAGPLPQSVCSRWLSFFGMLVGHPRQAKELCALGLELVSKGPSRDLDNVRDQVRKVLMSRTVLPETGSAHSRRESAL